VTARATTLNLPIAEIVLAGPRGFCAGVERAIDIVELALELGVEPRRIDTIADFSAGERHGVKTEGSAAGASAEVLAELAALVERGELEVPIARVYPLEEVRKAFRELEQGHTLGKIVLVP